MKCPYPLKTRLNLHVLSTGFASQSDGSGSQKSPYYYTPPFSFSLKSATTLYMLYHKKCNLPRGRLIYDTFCEYIILYGVYYYLEEKACGGHIDGGGRSGRRRIAPNCSDPGRANSEAVGGVICK